MYFRRGYECCQQGACKEMAKSKRKKMKAAVSAKKGKKTASGQTKAAEYVGYLWELHRLQGVLLSRLDKEFK